MWYYGFIYSYMYLLYVFNMYFFFIFSCLVGIRDKLWYFIMFGFVRCVHILWIHNLCNIHLNVNYFVLCFFPACIYSDPEYYDFISSVSLPQCNWSKQTQALFSNKPSLTFIMVKCLYNQTIVLGSTVTAQLSLLDCLQPLLLTAQNWLVFIQQETFN